jgi:ABC-type uncharacterized transport system ATPase component
MKKLENQITKIIIPNDNVGFFIGKSFAWDNIPDFAVITGINGSGKTQLLKYIYSILQSNQGNNTILNYSKSGEIYASYEVHYQATYQQPSVNEAIVQSTTIDNFKINKKNVIVGLLNQFRQTNQQFGKAEKLTGQNLIRIYNHQNGQIFDYQKTSYTEIKNIVEFLNITHDNSAEILKDETSILKAFFQINNSHIDEYTASLVADENNIASIKIFDLFLQYRNEIINLESAAYRQLLGVSDKSKTDSFIKQKLKEKFGIDKSPWDKINEILEKYKFQHKIEEPKDNMYEPSFKGGIKYRDLSDGEKVIFHLICSSYGGRGGIKGKTKLVLLDEFDAHLNPTMSKMFIDIVKDILVNEFGIQVIMTTHSPSTVAYVPEESLFWMEEGRILEGQNKKDKMWIIHKLATGFVSEDSTCPFMSYLVDPTKPYYVLVEGYTDILHIKTACKKLGGDYEKHILNKCNFINLGGTKEIYAKTFISNFGHDKRVITVLDNDKSGTDLLKDIFTNAYEQDKTNTNIKQNKKDIVGILLKSENTTDYKKQIDFGYIPIELMYPKSIIDDFSTNNPGFLRNITDIKDLEIFYANCGTASSIEGCFVIQKDKLKLKFANYVKDIEKNNFDGFKATLDLMLVVLKKWEEPILS